ncbi:porin [Pantoea sp. 1.19]|uniref:porin n=1 Tax=Pantoea sp. 1.19 TaxID=1925589 RepID=UPI000948F990|nr:porin [Pantoea sp. 1.19]
MAKQGTKGRGAAQAIVWGSVLWSSAALAEVTLLQQDRDNPDWLSRLNLAVGGSIRPQFNNMTGSGDKGSFKRNGFDGGTRFRFSADYALRDGVSWITYYEVGVNVPKVFNWEPHYAPGAPNTTKRMLYTGLKAGEMGTLTLGQQNSVYYDVVGAKTDIWDDDMLGQAPGNGISGDYDGSYRARKQMKFKNRYGQTELYGAWLFPDSEYLPGDGTRYRRKGGGSLGVDYHFSPDLVWGIAWNETRAEIKRPAGGDAKRYDQHIIGTALSWTPAQWTFAAGGGWYKNFLKTASHRPDSYFAGDAWGIEYFAGYKVPVGRAALKSVQPYIMGDRLQYTTGRDYHRIDNGLGITFQFDYGFRVDYEHVFTSSSDNLGDMNLVRLRYDF